MKKISFEVKFSRDKKTLSAVACVDGKPVIDKKLRSDWVASYHEMLSAFVRDIAI